MPRLPFTLDTNLKTTTSSLNAEFIDEYLKTKKNGDLAGIGRAAIDAARKYGINASYIVAHAAHESAWGSSRIAREKNNLFGWSAFDSSPYASAKGFPSREECIDFVMGRIDELYLTPGGRFYRRSPCLGFAGAGGYGMNVKYASDGDWGKKIARTADNAELAFERVERGAAPATLAAARASISTVDAMIERARKAAGRGTKYQLGQGGANPDSDYPSGSSSGCDCSGYVCWCLGMRRHTDHPLYVKFNAGWINTDAIVHDALSPTGLFAGIDRAKVGCLVVYPGKRPARPYGHVGIVTAISNGVARRVIHCSSGNYANLGDAIAETDADAFRKDDALFAWYEGMI